MLRDPIRICMHMHNSHTRLRARVRLRSAGSAITLPDRTDEEGPTKHTKPGRLDVRIDK